MHSTALKALALATMALLAGCGERPASTPLPGAPAAQGAEQPAAATGPQFAAAEDGPQVMGFPSRGTCSLENVVDMATQAPSPGSEPNSYRVARAASYRLIGFATDSEAGTVPSGLRLFLQGPQAYSIDAQGGLERADVAAFFKKPGLANAGYQADAGFANVQPGRYDVFVVNTFGGDRVLCPTHQAIIVE
jgi:hypothetical protein